MSQRLRRSGRIGDRVRHMRRRRSNRTLHRAAAETVDVDTGIPVIDMDAVPDEQPSCIDLTEDHEEFVDLTNVSVNDSSVVVLGSTHGSPSRRRSGRSQISLSSDSEDDELPEIILPGTPFVPMPRPDTQPSTSSTALSQSPQGKRISCPICLDSDGTILASERTLMSTVCGHVFCSECIKQAVKNQKRCPTCRKKLAMRNVHPLFI